MNNNWELYDDHPDFAAAHAAIETAWGEAQRIAPEAPFKDRANQAERHVYAVLRKWSHVGAMDTEPMAELRYRVRKHFGIEGGYV